MKITQKKLMKWRKWNYKNWCKSNRNCKDNFIHNKIYDLKNFLILKKSILKLYKNSSIWKSSLNIENDQDSEILFLNWLLKIIGHINKSYELIERYVLIDDKNFFYTEAKLNYLYQPSIRWSCNLNED